MSASKVYDAVSSVMPCAHLAFKVGSAPSLPWCVYYLSDIDGMSADNKFISRRNSWVVEHYWRDYDAEKESSLESVLEENFGVFSKSETWIDSENCCQTTYTFTEFE